MSNPEGSETVSVTYMRTRMDAKAVGSEMNIFTGKKPTKILMVINEMAWFWSHRLPLANAILENNWQLQVACHEASSDSQLTKLGVAAIDVPRVTHAWNLVGLFTMLISLARSIKVSEPDVVHVITIKYALFVGIVTKIIGFNSVIFTIAGLGSLFSSDSKKMRCLRVLVTPLLKFAFRGTGRLVIFQNPDDRAIFFKLGLINADQSFLIRGSGVDIERYRFVPYEETAEVPTILFASRLLRDKGVSDFITAARILKDSNFSANLVVAGGIVSGNSRFITLAEIEQAHADGVVEWLGSVPDIRVLMQKSMIVVFPSYYGEGVPKVLLEAAAIGRPIITCDMPGCREIVKNEVNGIFTPPKNPEALANAIVSLISRESARREQGIAGRRMVEASFNSEIVVRDTMQVYLHSLNASQRQLAIAE